MTALERVRRTLCCIREMRRRCCNSVSRGSQNRDYGATVRGMSSSGVRCATPNQASANTSRQECGGLPANDRFAGMCSQRGRGGFSTLRAP